MTASGIKSSSSNPTATEDSFRVPIMVCSPDGRRPQSGLAGAARATVGALPLREAGVDALPEVLRDDGEVPCGCSVVTHSSSPRIRYVRAPVAGSVTHMRFFQTDRPMYRSFLSMKRIVPGPQPRPPCLRYASSYGAGTPSSFRADAICFRPWLSE